MGTKKHDMKLGTFLISLAVKDLQASRAFYLKFGFKSSPAEGGGLGAREELTTSARIELTTRGTLLGARQGRRRAHHALGVGASPQEL